MSEYSKILTITVPSYNVEKTLKRTLDSFVHKDILSKLEVIVVNDGSKDSTSAVAEEFVKEYPETFKLINKENGGHGSTINSGVKAASGKYFKVIDGDDWVNTKEFAQFVEKLERCEEDVILASFNEVDFDGNITKPRNISCVPVNKTLKIEDVINKLSHDYCMHSITFKTELLKDNIAISQHCFYVDQEFINYPLNRVKTLKLLDNNVYQYVLGNVNQSVSIKSYQRNRAMLRRVNMNLCEFYENNKKTMGEGLNTYFKERLNGLAKILMNIYLSMPLNSVSFSELKSYMNEIKEKYPEVYVNIPGGTAKLMRKNLAVGIIIGWIKRHITGDTSL